MEHQSFEQLDLYHVPIVSL